LSPRRCGSACTSTAAMMDEVDVQALPHLRGDNLLERVVVFLSPVRLDQTQAVEDAVDVRVDGERRPLERVGEDAARAFRSNSRQGSQEGLCGIVVELVEE